MVDCQADAADSSVSVQQMMLALLRTNPDAFLNNNINGLKRGQILRMPSPEEMSALSGNEALSEARAQYRIWEDVRGKIASNIPEGADISNMDTGAVDDSYRDESLAGFSDDAADGAEDSSELRLVAGFDEDTGSAVEGEAAPEVARISPW